MSEMDNVDVRVALEPGSNLVLVKLETPAAKDWVRDHVQDPMTFGQQLVVEGRYLDVLIKGMQSDGLILESRKGMQLDGLGG